MIGPSLLRVSAIDAAFELERHLGQFAEASLQQAVAHLRIGLASAATLDFEAGAHLLSSLSREMFQTTGDRVGDLRRVIRAIAIEESPLWAQLSQFGRLRASEAMDADALQCLDYAGLFDIPPSQQTVDWWDVLSSLQRGREDERMLAAGRKGEILTLDYERRRIAQLGLVSCEPRWVAVDDNSLGYDVVSWDVSDTGEAFEIMIEVKASRSGPRRFVLSRNQWRTAEQYGSRYLLYHWDLSNDSLKILTVAELADHMPSDQGGGQWEEVAVRLSA